MSEPFSLWNHTPTRQAILDYLAAVTDSSSPDFIPPAERIAVFDNDGTLWCEKPMYIQFDYLLRKLALQAEEDSSLRKRQPWQAAWEKDFGWLGGAITKHYQGDDSDFRVLLGGILSLSEDQPVEQIEAEARRFIENERHPELDVPYRECVYRPMIEKLTASSITSSLEAGATSCAVSPTICMASPASGSLAVPSPTVW